MKTAIVHYWLVNTRGGEKALEAFLEMFPDADIYTHVYDPKSVSKTINEKRVFTSRVNRLPFAKKLYPVYLPLMPKALLDFNLQEYDLIISSEAGPAKGIVPNPYAYHICYCHSPMRYLWDMYHEYFKRKNAFARFFMKMFTPPLRIWDITSANMVDRFITNSQYVAKRILRYYRRKADVVFGPVPIEKFQNIVRKPSDYYLFFGQITDYKRVDIAIDACLRSGRKLIVAGNGLKNSEKRKYKKNSLISFKKNVSNEEAASLFSGALALLYPGIEDLGLVPIEAQAAGCPVIAFRGGGAMETIKENATGIFFDEQTPESLILAMDHFEKDLKFHNRDVFNEHVKRFSKEAFIERTLKIINERKHV